MTEENDYEDILESEEPLTYDDIATEEPEREVDFSQEYGGDSFSEVESSTQSTSDFKEITKILLHKFKDERIDEVVRPAMTSRIFADNFLDKYIFTIAMLVLEQDQFKPFDFLTMVDHVQDGFSFGYQGRGIEDLLDAIGVTKESDIANLSDNLFS